MGELTKEVAHLANPASRAAAFTEQAASAAVPQPMDWHVCDPESFFGDLDLCRGFLVQCGLVFRQRPLSFSTD